jgi:hypothetical protein|tara:strand:- start:101 stop:511 length:411 start_codon:yes stop_codon:yes gene_type:complete
VKRLKVKTIRTIDKDEFISYLQDKYGIDVIEGHKDSFHYKAELPYISITHQGLKKEGDKIQLDNLTEDEALEKYLLIFDLMYKSISHTGVRIEAVVFREYPRFMNDPLLVDCEFLVYSRLFFKVKEVKLEEPLCTE